MSRNIPTSTARRVRPSSQSINNSAKARLCGYHQNSPILSAHSKSGSMRTWSRTSWNTPAPMIPSPPEMKLRARSVLTTAGPFRRQSSELLKSLGERALRAEAAVPLGHGGAVVEVRPRSIRGPAAVQHQVQGGTHLPGRGRSHLSRADEPRPTTPSSSCTARQVPKPCTSKGRPGRPCLYRTGAWCPGWGDGRKSRRVRSSAVSDRPSSRPDRLCLRPCPDRCLSWFSP